ncbi:MAG: TraV family lipoprotein, partial [Colwellia sp.]
KISIFITVINLQACSIFLPYEDEFSCNKQDNLGKCVSAEEAYIEMTTGESSAPYMKPHSEKSSDDIEDEKNSYSSQNTYRNNGGYSSYLDAQYEEVAGLLTDNVTPIIKPVKTAELLILPYSENRNILKGERFINVILEDPGFVMGDYLKKKPTHINTLFSM